VGIAGRNLGAREATGDFIVFLDDDSYPLPGAVEAMLDIFDRLPDLGVLGGFVRDVDQHGRVRLDTEVGTFDWWLRNDEKGPTPSEGFPSVLLSRGRVHVPTERLPPGGRVL